MPLTLAEVMKKTPIGRPLVDLVVGLIREEHVSLGIRCRTFREAERIPKQNQLGPWSHNAGRFGGGCRSRR